MLIWNRLGIQAAMLLNQGASLLSASGSAGLGSCGSRSNRCCKYRCGLRSLALAISTMLQMIGLALAPRGVLLNRKFFRPITTCLIERSLRLLSISSRPSCKNTFSFSHWFVQLVIAVPSKLLGSTRDR